ncbi:hypothetical protein KIPB_014236, partial [Kipferlia bialata]|eukprot:g14236.t1
MSSISSVVDPSIPLTLLLPSLLALSILVKVAMLQFAVLSQNVLLPSLLCV